VSENCKPETVYVGVIADADPVYVEDLFSAVNKIASALAGVIGTRTELVSEKFVSFARVTLTLQVPLALIIVTNPVEVFIVHAVLVLVSKAKVPDKFGTGLTPSDRLALYVAVAVLPYFRLADTDAVKVSEALPMVTVLVSYAAR
jgi:hypothetical protein